MSVRRPTCIVVGCKNGVMANTDQVRYYQVPLIDCTTPGGGLSSDESPSSSSANSMARSWYINTLREDIYEDIVSRCLAPADQNFFVCLDHFDEEHRCGDGSVELKAGAVPSLFEVDVFQKMIAHQEQHALSKERLKQQQQRNSVLSSLILNDKSDADSTKRIERAQKAVKRTSLGGFMNQLSVTVSPSSQDTPPVAVRKQKAVKHTMPRPQANMDGSGVNELSILGTYLSNALKNSSPPPAHSPDQNGGGALRPKGSRQQSASILNDILPPPIMQSTKRLATPPVAKGAPKTAPAGEGGAKAFKPVTTTTYIYKRITQAPEIDLNLECEEEEIIYIDEPAVEDELKEPDQNMTSISDAIRSKLSQEDSSLKQEERSKKRREAPEPKPEETKPPVREALNTCGQVNGDKKKAEKMVDYQEILAQYYSRVPGTRLGGTRKPRTSHLPADLRPGDYPVQCHLCQDVLKNNIELISHICSHLENQPEQSAGSSVYISPFEAVTTTCSVCEQNFDHPFDLIKHLDLKHMQELGEYKCRICEHQHEKLDDLVGHLRRSHSREETPYRCDACGFRTSFYADAIFHIKTDHINTLRHFCPYCLKSLIMPFSEKLNHVQSTAFYSHLITHFNKHEGNKLVQSKCQHCQKCILHVRHLKQHLAMDHSNCGSLNDGEGGDEEFEDDEESSEEEVRSKSKRTRRGDSIDCMPPVLSAASKLNAQARQNGAEKRETTTSKYKLRERSATISARHAPQLDSSRKRRRSAASIDEARRSIKDQYEFRDDSGSDGDRSDESKNMEDINAAKKDAFSAGRRSSRTSAGRKPSSSSSNDALVVAKIPARRASSKANKASEDESKTKPSPLPSRSNGFKAEPNGDSAADFTDSDHKSKASGKPATAKLPQPSRIGRVKKPQPAPPSEPPAREPSPEPTMFSLTFCGNVRFNSEKFDFKCMECGDTSLKTHYKNAYNCHQCYYNTSCSNSFEHHLHGHLFKKRQALWNKPAKTDLEIYRCPCGFTINSETDNRASADTGNKVAAHLNECSFKYCQVTLQSDLEKTVKEEEGGADESAVILNSADNSVEIAPTVAQQALPVRVLEVSTNSEEAINLNSSTESAAAEAVQLETTNESMDTSKNDSMVEMETINERKMTTE